MSFKDEYEKLQRQIAPDGDFIERLSEKLQEEEQVKKKRNKTRFRAVMLSASAACAAAAAALVIFLGRPQAVIPDPDILNVGADKIDRMDGLFTPFDGQSGSVSLAELYEILSDENSTVYGSEKTTFDFDDKLGIEQCRELAERIRNAEPTSAEPNGKAIYYMAVSETGEIVKLSVSGNVLTIKNDRYLI